MSNDAKKYLDSEGLSYFWDKIKDHISESVQTISGKFESNSREISQAVDEPAVLYATQIIYLDQAGYEALEGGSRPSSSHWEYAGSGSSSILVHDSSSFTTLPVSNESTIQVPYAIALSTGTDEYASSYKLKPLSMMDWPYGGAVKISDLLAAGESGVKLTFTGSGDPYGNDGTLDIYASFSSLAEDSTNPPPYVVSYSAKKDAVTEEVLTAKIDGKDGSGETVSSVDVSPLLNYIGGRVEEVPDGDSEMLPLVDQENPNAEPPFYFADDFEFFNSGDKTIYPDTVGFSDGAMTISFSASSEPESFVPLLFYGDPSGAPGLAYAKVNSSLGKPALFPLETALAGPIVLDELDVSSGQPVPTGNTVSLITECVEGDVPAYRFTLYSGSVEIKKVLRLYPSCDNKIDISGLIPNVTDYQGATSSASGVAGLVPSALSEEKDRFLKGDGTWAEVSTAKEVGYSTISPTDQSVASLDDESIIFYEENSSNVAPEVLFVSTSGNQSISGVKTFADGINAASVVASGTVSASQFTGNGSGITGLNGSNISSGTVAVERLPVYQGATTSAAGVAGLVPSAAIADKDLYLKGDGTWAELVHPAAVTSTELSTGTDTSIKTVTAKVIHDYVAGEVASGVSGLVSSAPAALDTLNELAAALGNDPNFATTISGQIGSKLDASSANYVKGLSISGHTITYTKGDNTNGTLTSPKEVEYSTTEPTASSVASLDNESVIFYETQNMAAGTQSTAAISISGNAGTADSVNHSLSISVDGGAFEGSTLYTFNGSAEKTVNIAGGTGITLTGASGTITINANPFRGATSVLNGAAGSVPAPTVAEKDRFLRGDGTWAEVSLPDVYQGATGSTSGIAGLVPAASSAEKDMFLKGDGTWDEVLKEILVTSSIPTQTAVNLLDNNSLVFQEKTNAARSDMSNRHLAFLKFNESAVKDEDNILTWNEYGECNLSTTEYKFNSSLELSGSNAIYADNCILGGKDFTISFWAKVENASTQWLNRFFSFYIDGKECSIECNNGVFRPHINGIGQNVNDISIGDTWHHLEYVYVHNESLCELYVDGIKKMTISGSIKRGLTKFVIGAVCLSGTYFSKFLTGYIDAFQIADGVAAHRNNFTPQNGEYAIYVSGASVNASDAKVEDIAKKGTLYAKDQDGNFIKILPESCIADEDDTPFFINAEKTYTTQTAGASEEVLVVSTTSEVLQQISQFYSGSETGERFIYDGNYFGASSYSDRPQGSYDADVNIKLVKYNDKWTLESEPLVRSISLQRSVTGPFDMPFGTHTIDIKEEGNTLFVRVGYTLTSEGNVTFTRFDIYKVIRNVRNNTQLQLTAKFNKTTVIDFNYVGATDINGGTSGFVPAAIPSERNRFLRGDGTWAELTLPDVYQGATSSASGVTGLVPAATSAQKDSFLAGDGNWTTLDTISNAEVDALFEEELEEGEGE